MAITVDALKPILQSHGTILFDGPKIDQEKVKQIFLGDREDESPDLEDEEDDECDD